MSTATYCHSNFTALGSAVDGGLGALAPLGAAGPPPSPPAASATATTAKELPKKKFATKQAKNRETSRLRKLAKHHRSGTKHSAETIERIRATRQAQERDRKAAANPVSRPAVVPSKADQSRQLYRETVAERRPIIAAREAAIMASVKKTIEEADARMQELRHRGRPKGAKRLPPMFIRSSPDALIAAVPQWQGER